MNDPRNHALSAIYPNRPQVPEHGSLLELATEQAADHKRRAERVAAKSRALPAVDDRRSRMIEKVRNDLITDSFWRKDVVGEATVSRERRIIDAWLAEDITELGAILSEGLTAEFMAIVDKRLEAEA